MSRKKAAVEAIKAKKAQERAEARAEAEAKAQAAKGKTTSRASKASKSSNASKSKLPPPALSEAPTSTGFVAAKRLEDATPEELERLRLTPDGRMFRGEMLSSKPRALNVESNAESAQKAEIAEKAGTEATPATAPLDPADWTARPHTSFKTRLYDQYARNSAARATLLDRFAEMERERKEREEREAKEKDDDAARRAAPETGHDEYDEHDEHQPPQPSDTEYAMTTTNRTASETLEADEDDEPLDSLDHRDPRLEETDGEVDLDDFDYNPEGLARMISDGYSDEEDEDEDDEDDDASEDEGEDEEDEEEDEDGVPASVAAGAAAAAAPASPASPAAKTSAKTAGKTESAEASASSGNSGKNPAKVEPEAQKKPSEKAPAKTPVTALKAPKTQAAAPKKTPAKAQAPKTAAKNTPKNGAKTAAKPQVTAQGKKGTQQPKTRAKQQPQQPKPAASAPKTSEPVTPKASIPELKAPAIEPVTSFVTEAQVPADVVERVAEPVVEPVMDSALLKEEPAFVAVPVAHEVPAAAQAPEPDASAKPEKPEKPAKKVRDKTGRRAHGYADALRHAADVKAAAEARVEVSLGRTLDEINGASDEDNEETEAEIETMTPALRFSTANATLEADEPAPMLASQGTKGSKASRDGTLPEVERIDGRRATLPRNRTGKVLPRITPLYADDPAPVDVGRAYLYAVDERARALMDEDADRLMEEGFRDRYVVRTDRDGPSPVENCLRLEAETPAILDAEAAARRARLEKEDARLEATDRTDDRADDTIEGDAREPRKAVRFGRFPFALLPGKRARAAAANATNMTNATTAETTSDRNEEAETDEAREVPEVCEPVDAEEARTTPARDAVAEATEGKKAAGTVPAAKTRGASVERPADAAPAAHGARKGESSNASAASTASKSSKGSSSEAASKTSFSRPTKTTVVLGLTALVASGLAIALAFTHPAVEAGVKKTAEVLKSWVPAALTGESAADRLHPAILVVDRGAVEERAALARLAATRPGAQAARDSQEPNPFASIDREAIDRAIEATAAEHRAIVLDRRLVLAAAPEFALERTTASATSATSATSAIPTTSGNSATSPAMPLDATPEVLRRLGLDKTDPAALERAVMEHWFPKAKEARGTENAMKAGTASESVESAESIGVAGVAGAAATAAPAKTLRDLAALLLPEGAEHGTSDAAAGFLLVK